MSMQLMMALVLMMGITVIGLAEAQDVIPPCAYELPSCLDYINSTNPPNFCCDPIKYLYATQQTCLCKLVFTPDIIEGFGINSTQAIKFGHSCGLDLNITMCKGTYIIYVCFYSYNLNIDYWVLASSWILLRFNQCYFELENLNRYALFNQKNFN